MPRRTSWSSWARCIGNATTHRCLSRRRLQSARCSGGANGSNPSLDAVYEVFEAEFEVALEERGLYLLTMHPHIMGHRSRVRLLDELIEHMKSERVWFATHEQIASYLQEKFQGSTVPKF